MSFWRIPFLNRYKDQIAARPTDQESETLPLSTSSPIRRRDFLRSLSSRGTLSLLALAGGSSTSLMQVLNGQKMINDADKGIKVKPWSSSDIYNTLIDPSLSATSVALSCNTLSALLQKQSILSKMQTLSELFLESPSTNISYKEKAKELLESLQISTHELKNINKILRELGINNSSDLPVPIIALMVFDLHLLLKFNFKNSVNGYAKAVAHNRANKKLRNQVVGQNVSLSWLSMPSGGLSVVSFLAKAMTTKSYLRMFDIGSQLSHHINDDSNSSDELKKLSREILVALQELAPPPGEEAQQSS